MDFFERLHNKIRIFSIKAQVSKIGENAHVFGKTFLVDPKSIQIGNDFRINEGAKILGRNGSKIIIGDDVTLSSNATVLASGYDVDKWISEGTKKHISTTTIIGNHVWVCANATVCGGVKITGEYVVIGAGAVVTSDIAESYCLYGGVPARLIKKYRN